MMWIAAIFIYLTIAVVFECFIKVLFILAHANLPNYFPNFWIFQQNIWGRQLQQIYSVFLKNILVYDSHTNFLSAQTVFFPALNVINALCQTSYHKNSPQFLLTCSFNYLLLTYDCWLLWARTVNLFSTFELFRLYHPLCNFCYHLIISLLSSVSCFQP